MLGETCPRGFICINHFHALLVLTGVIVVVYYVNQNNYRDLYKKINNLSDNEFENIKQNIVSNDSLLSPQNDIKHAMSNHLFYQNSNDVLQRDRKVINNPLYPPLKRDYHVEQDQPRGIPINIETRGSSGNFQQIGILSKNIIADDNQTPGNNTDSNVLPLYGKPTYRGSNQWLYYTETDKLNPVKIPITVNNKDCTDDYGCKELYDGDSVDIPAYNGTFNVKIYKFDKPRYIPY